MTPVYARGAGHVRAGIDSRSHDLYSGLQRLTADTLIFVRRDAKFGVVQKDAPIPGLKSPNLQKT